MVDKKWASLSARVHHRRESNQTLTLKWSRARCGGRVWDIKNGLLLLTVTALSGYVSLCFAQTSINIASPEHKAWDILQKAVSARSTEERAQAAAALGLIPENPRARETAESLLKDGKPEVRVAAATALGQMHGTESIPILQQALRDHNVPVVMAAAKALSLLQDSGSAHEVYIELLTGERKSGEGLIAQQIAMLHNRKKLEEIGFSEGIGFVPFAGMAWHVYRTVHKENPNPVRAVAATYLAQDRDPASARALVRATDDKNWIVRVAAIQAIAQRGDPSLLPRVQLRFSDRHAKVRYSAAAAVIHLSAMKTSEMNNEDKLSDVDDSSAQNTGSAEYK